MLGTPSQSPIACFQSCLEILIALREREVIYWSANVSRSWNVIYWFNGSRRLTTAGLWQRWRIRLRTKALWPAKKSKRFANTLSLFLSMTHIRICSVELFAFNQTGFCCSMPNWEPTANKHKIYLTRQANSSSPVLSIALKTKWEREFVCKVIGVLCRAELSIELPMESS